MEELSVMVVQVSLKEDSIGERLLQVWGGPAGTRLSVYQAAILAILLPAYSQEQPINYALGPKTVVVAGVAE